MYQIAWPDDQLAVDVARIIDPKLEKLAANAFFALSWRARFSGGTIRVYDSPKELSRDEFETILNERSRYMSELSYRDMSGWPKPVRNSGAASGD